MLAVKLQARGDGPQLYRSGSVCHDPEIAECSTVQDTGSRRQILIIEDDPHEGRLLEAYLQGMSAEVRIVKSVQDAVSALQHEDFDLVVLDLLLPDGDGFAVVGQMRASIRHAQTPILVVSSIVDTCHRVPQLELGADDFISKGSDRLELEARVRRLLRMKRSLDQLVRRCDHALQLAVTDSLTGLFTHGFLWETLHRQVACARRYEWPLSLLFIDIDHFKSINDRHGHAQGDEVLRAVESYVVGRAQKATLCTIRRRGIRRSPAPYCRCGAVGIAERIRAAAEAVTVHDPHAPRSAAPVTVSIGVATLPDDATDSRTLLERADEAMYRAKRAGRNQVSTLSNAPSAAKVNSRLLLVDDDPKNLRLLEAYLKTEGHELLTATDGEEAIAMALRAT